MLHPPPLPSTHPLVALFVKVYVFNPKHKNRIKKIGINKLTTQKRRFLLPDSVIVANMYSVQRQPLTHTQMKSLLLTLSVSFFGSLSLFAESFETAFDATTISQAAVTSQVPEPSSLSILGLGLLVLFVKRKRVA